MLNCIQNHGNIKYYVSDNMLIIFKSGILVASNMFVGNDLFLLRVEGDSVINAGIANKILHSTKTGNRALQQNCRYSLIRKSNG